MIAACKLPSVVVRQLLNSLCPCQTSCRNVLPLGQYGITVGDWWWLIDCSHAGLQGSSQHLLDTAKLGSPCWALTVSSHPLQWPRKDISLHCFHIGLNDDSWETPSSFVLPVFNVSMFTIVTPVGKSPLIIDILAGMWNVYALMIHSLVRCYEPKLKLSFSFLEQMASDAWFCSGQISLY